MSRTHYLLMTRTSGASGSIILPREVATVLSKVSVEAFLIYHHLRTLPSKTACPDVLEPSVIAEQLGLDEQDVADWIHELSLARLILIEYFNNLTGEIAHLIVGSSEVAHHLNTLKGKE